MMKSKLLFVMVVIGNLTASAQQLTCADFKIGRFYIPESMEKAKYTAIADANHLEFITVHDTTAIKYTVIRDEQTQIEWKNGVGNGEPEYELIEWIDDCTYRLTYDDSKMELDNAQRWINNNNGIVVSKTHIEGNCIHYNATLTTKKGRKISQEGVICRE